MSEKYSRYRKLRTRVATEPDGSVREYTALRPTPLVEGTIEHTVTDTDRLDHLAYTYYRRSRKWWRILDANPQAETPFSLLGDPARATLTLEIELPDPASFSFARLRATLESMVGVKRVSIEEQFTGNAPANRLFPGESTPTTVQVPVWRRTVTIDYYVSRADVGTLTAAVEAEGATVSDLRRHEQVGRQIVIPTDTRG